MISPVKKLFGNFRISDLISDNVKLLRKTPLTLNTSKVRHELARPINNDLYASLKQARDKREAAKKQIHHSDHGAQYARRTFRYLLKTHSFQDSMNRKGDCWERQGRGFKLLWQLEAGARAMAELSTPV